MEFGGRYVSMNFNVVYNVGYRHIIYLQKVLSHPSHPHTPHPLILAATHLFFVTRNIFGGCHMIYVESYATTLAAVLPDKVLNLSKLLHLK